MPHTNHMVVYTGTEPTDTQVVSNSFTAGTGAVWSGSLTQSNSLTVQFSVSSLVYNTTYSYKWVVVGSAGATATATGSFTSQFPQSQIFKGARRRRNLVRM